MDKNFDAPHWESQIRDQWATSQAFRAPNPPPKDSSTPFVIVLPPPNANGSLHAGHVMMVYQDIMCRFARSQGRSVLYIPGTDHAGFETQYVFEKHLSKQGKSRFDYDRETLYQMIREFVESSKGTIISQFKSIGFSLDWSREQFTLDPTIVQIVHRTFKKLFDAGLIYRADRLVNYSPKDGTSFSDLEVVHEETMGTLYHIAYPLVGDEKSSITIATTRPETLLGDAAVMVHPDDPRYTHLIGKEVMLPICKRRIPIIADTAVDMTFGTGAVKVTPAHDFTDFEVGKRHSLPYTAIIGFDGRIKSTGTSYDGMKVKAAREAIIIELTTTGALIHHAPHQMVLQKSYKSGDILEPLPMQQWFIKVKPLANRAKQAIESGEIVVHPPRFKDILTQILDNYIDWNISRQIVWGIRIPAFKHAQTGKWRVETDTDIQKELISSGEWIQDTDTFDTWFSSGQWPFATIMAIAANENGVNVSDLYDLISKSPTDSQQSSPTNHISPSHSSSSLLKSPNSKLVTSAAFFNYYYPTSVMETGYDIARAWVARMMMLGYFVTGKPPFKEVYLHGMVRDGKGQKMSKSKGNVIDPLKLTEKYGTDALRAALIFGTTAGNDASLSEEKVKGMRNFMNKIWNIARFLTLPPTTPTDTDHTQTKLPPDVLQTLQMEFVTLQESHIKHMAAYDYSQALQDLHEFIWHRFADHYIEVCKEAIRYGDISVRTTLQKTFDGCIDMLDPFTPFLCQTIRTVTSGSKNELHEVQ